MSQLHPRSAASDIHQALRRFIAIVIALFCVNWAIALWNRSTHRLEEAWSTPLFETRYRFSDWIDYLPRASHFREAHFLIAPNFGSHFSYPIPCLYLIVPFVKLFPRHAIGAYVWAACLVFVAVAVWFSLYLRKIGASVTMQVTVLVALLLGSPAAFLVDRGNIEVFIWLFIVLGMAAFLRTRPYLAACCFACAASCKIYPAIFFLLFVPRKQWKALVLAVALTGTILFGSIVAAGPSLPQTLQDISTNSKELRDFQLTQVSENNLRWDHSLLGVGKQFTYAYEVKISHAIRKGDPLYFGEELQYYTYFVFALFLGLYIFRIRKLPILNQFAALTLCALLLPFASYEYTLVHVYTVWALFLVYLVQIGRDGSLPYPARSLNLFTACFAVVLSVITATALRHFGGQVKSILLTVLLILFLRYPMPGSLLELTPLPRPIQPGAHT